MTAYISIHNGTRITAEVVISPGAPLTIMADDDASNRVGEVTFFLGDPALAASHADAINAATKAHDERRAGAPTMVADMAEMLVSAQLREVDAGGLSAFDQNVIRMAARILDAQAGALDILTKERDEVRRVLAAGDYGSLPHDWSVVQIAEARMGDLLKADTAARSLRDGSA